MTGSFQRSGNPVNVSRAGFIRKSRNGHRGTGGFRSAILRSHRSRFRVGWRGGNRLQSVSDCAGSGFTRNNAALEDGACPRVVSLLAAGAAGSHRLRCGHSATRASGCRRDRSTATAASGGRSRAAVKNRSTAAGGTTAALRAGTSRGAAASSGSTASSHHRSTAASRATAAHRSGAAAGAGMMHVMTGAIPVTAVLGTVPGHILLSAQRTAFVALVLLEAELFEQRRLRRSRLRVVPAWLINAALIRVIVVAVKAGRLTASGGQTRQYARNKQHDPVHHSVPGCRRDRARRFRPVIRFCERSSFEIQTFAEAGLPVHRPPGQLDFTGYDGRTGFGRGAGQASSGS